jgi:hypothetical protein
MEEIAIGGSFEFTEINNKPKERRNIKVCNPLIKKEDNRYFLIFPIRKLDNVILFFSLKRVLFLLYSIQLYKFLERPFEELKTIYVTPLFIEFL